MERICQGKGRESGISALGPPVSGKQAQWQGLVRVPVRYFYLEPLNDGINSLIGR